jgi:hypothetical protein
VAVLTKTFARRTTSSLTTTTVATNCFSSDSPVERILSVLVLALCVELVSVSPGRWASFGRCMPTTSPSIRLRRSRAATGVGGGTARARHPNSQSKSRTRTGISRKAQVPTGLWVLKRISRSRLWAYGIPWEVLDILTMCGWKPRQRTNHMASTIQTYIRVGGVFQLNLVNTDAE